MFEKVAEDLYWATMCKLALYPNIKIAGQAANKKLIEAMTRARKGLAPTMGEFVDKVKDTRKPVEFINKGVEVNNSKSRMVVPETYKELVNASKGRQNLIPYDDYVTLKNILDSDNITPAQKKRLQYYFNKFEKEHDRVIGYTTGRDYPIFKDDVKEFDKALKEYNKSLNDYTDYYFNTINPGAKGRTKALSLQNEIYEGLQPRKSGKFDEPVELIRSLEATPDRYQAYAHRETMNPQRFADEYQNTLEQMRSIADEEAMKEINKVKDINFKDVHGMSMQKAIDRYGGGMDNALFRGGDTDGRAGSGESARDIKAAPGKVLSIMESPQGGINGNVGGMASISSRMGHVPFGQGNADVYNGNAGNLIFFSGIPQVPIGYASGHNTGSVSAIPYGIANGKLIRHLNHVAARNNASAGNSAVSQIRNNNKVTYRNYYDRGKVDRVTDTHPYMGTTNLDEINKQQLNNRNNKSHVSKGYNDPGDSPYYETQIPSNVLNTPGVYTRGVLIGRGNNITGNSFGDASTVNPYSTSNGYKKLMQDKMKTPGFNNNFAFIPANEFRKVSVPVENARKAYRNRDIKLEGATDLFAKGVRNTAGTTTPMRPANVNTHLSNMRETLYNKAWGREISSPYKVNNMFLTKDKAKNSPFRTKYRNIMGNYADNYGSLIDDATIYR